MKNSFKRFLSSVLAVVVAVVSMSFGMVTAVSAATNTYEYTMTPALNTSNYFTIGGNSKNTTNTFPTGYDTDGYTITLADGTTSTITEALKMNSSGSVTFNVTGTATVRIISSTKSKSTSTAKIGIKKDGVVTDNIITMNTDGFYDTTFNLTEAGEYSIYRTSTESNLYYVRVDETISDNAKTYTIKGTCNLTSGTFTLGDMEATIASDGTWSVSKVAETAPFAVNDILAVSLAQYTINPETVTLTAGDDDLTFNGGYIEFTQQTLSAIPAGTYTPADIEAGLPNFDISNLSINATGKYNTSSLNVMLSDVATITVNGKCGSSNTSRSASVTINGSTQTSAGGSSAADYVFDNVPAGEQTIAFEANSTTFQVVSITISYGATSTESTESTSEASTESTTEASTETTTAAVASVITDKATYTASEVYDVLAADKVEGYFTVMNGCKTASSSKTIASLGTSYDVALKTNGRTTLDSTTGVPTRRALKFTTAGAGTVQIAGLSGSSSTDRDCAVYSSDGTVIGSVTLPANAKDADGNYVDVLVSNVINLPKADTYYIASAVDNITIYSVNVVVGNGVVDGTTAGKVYSDTTDAYMISAVSAADLAYDNIVVSVDVSEFDDSVVAVDDTVVYKAALIDGNLITAEELGADYIYVVKAVDAVVNNALDTVKSFTTTFTNNQ